MPQSSLNNSKTEDYAKAQKKRQRRCNPDFEILMTNKAIEEKAEQDKIIADAQAAIDAEMREEAKAESLALKKAAIEKAKNHAVES